MTHHSPTAAPTFTGLRFRVTRIDGGAVTWTTTNNEADTVSLLRRAVRVRRATVEARRSGGFIMRWTVHHLTGEPSTATITAEPLTPARLTKTMRADLEHIAEHPSRARWRTDGSLHVGFLGRIPPATARRLADRGLIASDTANSAAVRLTLAARLALLAEQHRTSTRQPRGWYRPGDYLRPGEWALSAGLCRGGGKSGLMHDGTSSATCSCGDFYEPANDRRDAAHRAREHRQYAAAALVATL
ncbi:hypothetical protein [Nocardia sp. CA-120079]|uniref:hypothetical protein n=1 Tax=Nocardia sp. CA-120079 TaxID=3239974 RepID=UPI003D9656A8